MMKTVMSSQASLGQISEQNSVQTASHPSSGHLLPKSLEKGIGRKFFRSSCLWVGVLILSACGQRVGLAPVVESNWRAANTHATRHVVERGETLYAIAFRYDQDYRRLAIANHLRSPYTLKVGQVIRLEATHYRPVRILPVKSVRPVNPVRSVRPMESVKPRYAKPIWHPRNKAHATDASNGWLWPVHGRIVASYLPEQGRKGIDIAGHKGQKIVASSSGVVAYSGSGLSGYGNLIIIKHDNQYLTAYGNNLRNLVREGQHIKAGQVIAEIGMINKQDWGVHFEIRRAGKPVNPLNYLQKG